MTLKKRLLWNSPESVPAEVKRRIIFDFIDSFEDAGMSRGGGSFTAAMRSQAESYLKYGSNAREVGDDSPLYASHFEDRNRRADQGFDQGG